LRAIGHVSDLSTHDASQVEYERTLRKTATKGVVTLFNAIRASQTKAQEAQSQSTNLSRNQREEKVKEMSKEGFLTLLKTS
jgi:Rrp15p